MYSVRFGVFVVHWLYRSFMKLGNGMVNGNNVLVVCYIGRWSVGSRGIETFSGRVQA